MQCLPRRYVTAKLRRTRVFFRRSKFYDDYTTRDVLGSPRKNVPVTKMGEKKNRFRVRVLRASSDGSKNMKGIGTRKTRRFYNRVEFSGPRALFSKACTTNYRKLRYLPAKCGIFYMGCRSRIPLRTERFC